MTILTRDAYLIVVDPIVGSNGINAIVTTQVSSPDGQMVGFNVNGEVQDNVELGAVH